MAGGAGRPDGLTLWQPFRLDLIALIGDVVAACAVAVLAGNASGGVTRGRPFQHLRYVAARTDTGLPQRRLLRRGEEREKEKDQERQFLSSH